MPLFRWSAIVTIWAMAIGGMLMPGRLSSDQPATPDVAAAGVSAETLVDANLAESIPDPAFLGLIRLVVPPGVDVPGGRVSGYRIVVVERGELTVQLAANPAAGDGIASAGDADFGDKQRLGAGDALVVLPDVEHRIRNASSEAVTSLDIVVLRAPPPAITPATTETGIVFQPLLVGDFQSMPVSPARITLERTTLPEAVERFAQPAPGPVLAYVESGELTVTATHGRVEFRRSAAPIPGSVSGPLETAAPGATFAVSAGAMLQLHSAASADIRSVDDRSSRLLVLAISPSK